MRQERFTTLLPEASAVARYSMTMRPGMAFRIGFVLGESNRNVVDMKRIIVLFCIFTVCSVGILGGRYGYISAKYPTILEKNELKRIEFLSAYKLSKTEEDRKIIIGQVRNYLNEILTTKIFPAWYGTPWSFNGNAQYPFKGSIACGSFVENVLKNVGFQVDRRMSSQPSEYIIKNMCDENDITKFSNASIKSFNNKIQNMGDGIYLVGLDSHVGFLYTRKGNYRFVHSHGYLFVLSEIPSLSPTLRMSKYRVVGKLFSDKMIEKWLYSKKIILTYDYFEKKHR
jgi:hypothetical protein